MYTLTANDIIEATFCVSFDILCVKPGVVFERLLRINKVFCISCPLIAAPPAEGMQGVISQLDSWKDVIFHILHSCIQFCFCVGVFFLSPEAPMLTICDVFGFSLIFLSASTPIAYHYHLHF